MITHEELMRYIDGELPPERARAVEEAIERSTELRRDYVVYSRIKNDLRELGEEIDVSDSAWDGVNRRLTRPFGWMLFLIGVAVWLGYGIYGFVTGADALWQKLATGAVVVGLGMLLLSAILDRLRDLKTDPYREIER